MRRAVSPAALAAALLAAGCVSVPPERAAHEAVLWDAARECERRFTNIRVKEIDHLGRLWITVRDTMADTRPFYACYDETAKAKLAAPGK
jgi:hypothetical protein